MKKWIPILCLLLLFFMAVFFQNEPNESQKTNRKHSMDLKEEEKEKFEEEVQEKQNKKETTKTMKVLEMVVFQSKKKEDPNLQEGKVFVEQEGIPGQREKLIEITYADEAEVSRKVIQKNMIKEPMDEILVVGTKKGDSKESTFGNSGVVFFSYEEAKQWAESLMQEAKSTEIGEKIEGGYGGYTILPIVHEDPRDGKEKQAYTIEWY